MLRALWFLSVVAAFSLIFSWLADSPGRVSVVWQGYRVETSMAILISVIIGISIITAVLYRLWLMICNAPKQIKGIWRTHNKSRGYKALTQGMVAVAAGDSKDALRQVKRAEILLNEPPLTMLLSAQAAQLDGDESAAKNFFTLMTKEKQTEFLGLRGLITQSIRGGNHETSLALARRAYALKPESEWVKKILLELEVKAGLWIDAVSTCKKITKPSRIRNKSNDKFQATLLYQAGLEAKNKNNLTSAYNQFKQAVNLDPSFIPGVVEFIGQLIRRKKVQKATSLIEKVWKNEPHPYLVKWYWQVVKTKTPIGRFEASERLLSLNPDHIESHLVVVVAALEAKLWGKARKHLKLLSDMESKKINARVCGLWAELEKAENDDVEQEHLWLKRAVNAPPPLTWVCGVCRNISSEWVSVCGNCDSFSTFIWSEVFDATIEVPVNTVTLGRIPFKGDLIE
jgi:HemY protein